MSRSSDLSEEQRSDLAARGGGLFIAGTISSHEQALWDVLGVEPGATSEEIVAAKKACFREAQRNQGDNIASRIEAVRKAAAILLEPGRRRMYELLGGDVVAANSCLDADEIRPGLWLGGKDFLVGRGLQVIGATHVLTVAKGLHIPASAEVVHLTLAVDDSPDENMFDGHIDVGLRFILDAISVGGCVFVHCMAGVSRSATLVLAYLMQHESLALSNAYEEVRTKRPLIDPNSGFMRQLVAFERSLSNPDAGRAQLLEAAMCEADESIEMIVGGGWHVWGAERSRADRGDKGLA